jgi:hypothetical protein
LEVAVSQSSRKYGFVRDNIVAAWTPGNAYGNAQHAYSRELAGAMLHEAEVFFDRALALYLLRSHLREFQASTWAGVATYYSNYFLALSFTRLHMRSVTHLPTGPIFEVTRTDDQAPRFKIVQRRERQKHTEVWRTYYEVVTRMGWPDSATTAEIAPTLSSLRFREQQYRERINYRPGEGFGEIYLTRKRYFKSLKAELADEGATSDLLSDAAYTDRMAARRLRHMATLLHRIRDFRIDPDVEASLWDRRMDIVARYSCDPTDKQFAQSLIVSPVQAIR